MPPAARNGAACPFSIKPYLRGAATKHEAPAPYAIFAALLFMLPGPPSLVMCMFTLFSHLHYALPYICAMPIIIAAYYANGVIKDEQQLEKGC